MDKTNRYRILNCLLLISSLFCYLEWADQSAFLFEVEYALAFKASQSIESLAHPFIIIPILGQLLLLIALIKPDRKVTFTGLSLISLLVLMIFLTGILAANARIICSTVPFIAISVITFVLYKKPVKV